ncbi:MAG: hypothetical protein ACLUD2_00700 [Clostridium sp.]
MDRLAKAGRVGGKYAERQKFRYHCGDRNCHEQFRIGIIRVSGEQAVSIVNRIFISRKDNFDLNTAPSHHIYYGMIQDGEEVLDEVLVMLMRGPHSYTAEDTVEIDCHGGVLVMKKILETVIKYGARPAEPGEFTKRAFLNGRIDLVTGGGRDRCDQRAEMITR